MLKNFSSGYPHLQKFYNTIAIVNKCFKFQNDWLKIICIRHNCTQFCSIPLQCSMPFILQCAFQFHQIKFLLLIFTYVSGFTNNRTVFCFKMFPKLFYLNENIIVNSISCFKMLSTCYIIIYKILFKFTLRVKENRFFYDFTKFHIVTGPR